MESVMSLEHLLFLLLPLFIIYFTFHYITSNKTRDTKNNSKGFKNYPILGSLPEFLLNRHRFLDWTTEILSRCPTKTAVFRRPGKVHGVITANPANVEYMLKTNFENYPKGPRFISFLEDMLGRGIFNSDGELWRMQRKTASYEFNTKSLRYFVMDNVRIEISTRLVPVLAEAASKEQTLDLQDALERFAFDNICKLAFNVDPGCLGGDASAGADFMRAFDIASTLSSGRFMSANPSIWKIKRLFNLGSERVLKEAIVTVHRFAEDIIQARIEAKAENKNEDLLSRFIGVEAMNSPELLRDIVISFILAGRDTTSSALSWFFWLLSLNPDVEHKILKELQMIRSRAGKNIGDTYSFEELRDMHYLHAAISESLRLYPPVPVDTKCCLKGEVLPDGTFIGEGWFISYHTYAMGRLESIWGKDCLKFLPERWLENGVCRQENPFKFPVFHAGPRTCLGKDMAYIQMKSIAASLVERFVIDVPNKHKHPEYLMSLTLRVKGGLHVRVKERSDNVVG